MTAGLVAVSSAGTSLVEFRVYGIPAPQGSKKGYVRGGRVVLVESSAKVRPWREAVLYAALEARGDRPRLDGPLVVSVLFYLPRPKSVPKRRVTWPDRRPDVDKLARSTLDALGSAGVFGDDGQVVRLHVGKDWASAVSLPGAAISVGPMVEAAS